MKSIELPTVTEITIFQNFTFDFNLTCIVKFGHSWTPSHGLKQRRPKVKTPRIGQYKESGVDLDQTERSELKRHNLSIYLFVYLSFCHVLLACLSVTVFHKPTFPMMYFIYNVYA